MLTLCHEAVMFFGYKNGMAVFPFALYLFQSWQCHKIRHVHGLQKPFDTELSKLINVWP